MFDLNLETWGMNQKPGESATEYTKRVFDQNYVNKRSDHALYEFCPKRAQQINAKIKTSPNTFYFSITTGEQKSFK